MPVERKYLLSIHERWLECETAERTRDFGAVSDIHAVHDVTLELRSVQGDEFEMIIPDIAGEAFSEVWERRTWASSIQVALERAESLILFVHPGDVIYPTSIADMRVALFGPEDSHNDRKDELILEDEPELQDAEDATEWNPEVAPTQVKLVDILDSALSLVTSGPRKRVAVVISAWDRVRDDGVEPARWVDLNLPLLSQYLTSNSETITHHVFGISAQGGDYSDPEEVKRLTSLDLASERVEVRDDAQTHHDITAPLRWVLAP
jgi:hypothetical protein